jgi:putative tryptophan/tyrosine transport system substrate-binding protein
MDAHGQDTGPRHVKGCIMVARRTLRVVAVVVVVAVLVGLVIILNRPKPPDKQVVGVIEPMEHVAISDVTRGIKEGLEARQDLEVRVMNASGDATTTAQIVDKYRDIGVAIYVPVFTKTAQVVKSKITDSPIVFAAVTDPVSAGLVKCPGAPEGNITGVSDLWPIGANLDLIRKVMPTAKVIGMVYDPGDASSSVTVPLITTEAEARGFKLESRPVHSTNEVAQSLASLQGKVDLMFTANDVTVTAALPALVEFAIQKKIPLFAGDYSSVQRGAVCAVGQNYYSVGAETAELIAALIDGKKTSEIPIRYTKGGDIYVNAKAAELMGVQIPRDIAAKAKATYTDISSKEK